MVRALMFVIALCGCRDKATEQVKDVRDEVCACETAKCGEDAMKLLPQTDVKPTRRATALAHEMRDCMAKLYLRDRPSTDPDREAPPGSAGSSDPAAAKPP